MAKRKFTITVTQTATLELDDEVIKQVDDDWRKTFYSNVRTPEDIAGHIGTNMIRFNDGRLSQIEGFANLDDKLAVISAEDWETEATLVRPRVKAV